MMGKMKKQQLDHKMKKITGEELPLSIPYIVYENSENRNTKREIWHWIIHIILICTVAMMMWNFFQYDTISYEQDGKGYNNINTGSQGSVTNGAEIESSQGQK